MKIYRPKLCECGTCGLPVKLGKRFIHGHYMRTKEAHEFYSNRMKGNLLFFGHTHIDSSKKAISKSQMGENNSVWNGGRTVSAGGYISILFPSHPYANINGRVKEERLVMEKFLGRYLIKEEIVHHKNKDKQDNRLDNLQLVSVSEHLKIHWNDLDRKRLKMENRKSV